MSNESKHYPIEPLSTFHEDDRRRPKAKAPAKVEAPVEVKFLKSGKYR